MTASAFAPRADEARAAREALRQVRGYLDSHPESLASVPVASSDGPDELVLPRSAIELLAGVLAHMAAGRGVSIVPMHAELTTQQAADLLNVSRPHLIGLLESGEIEFRMVGTHRRVRADSLVEYMRRDDQRRRAAADELTAMNQELGFD